ncbi:MAG: CHRD domain-containing protein [Cyclobacteriaceae bacterium]
MKNILQLVSKMVWKGKVIMICFFLFAACIPHDESLVPMDNHENLLSDDLVQGSEVSGLHKSTFTAHLSGANEVPPVDLNGQGQAIFKLSKDGTELHYKLIVANIENVTQSHIHCGDAGVNGPVVVFLFRSATGGVTQNGVLAEGVITSANIIARGSSAACMGGLATFANLLDKMRNGSAYVNVHTVAFPGGEIRGQVN